MSNETGNERLAEIAAILQNIIIWCNREEQDSIRDRAIQEAQRGLDKLEAALAESVAQPRGVSIEQVRDILMDINVANFGMHEHFATPKAKAIIAALIAPPAPAVSNKLEEICKQLLNRPAHNHQEVAWHEACPACKAAKYAAEAALYAADHAVDVAGAQEAIRKVSKP